MKVGDLVRDIGDPHGEIGILIKIIEKHEESDLVMVKYPSARLFIYTRELQLVSPSTTRQERDE